MKILLLLLLIISALLMFYFLIRNYKQKASFREKGIFTPDEMKTFVEKIKQDQKAALAVKGYNKMFKKPHRLPLASMCSGYTIRTKKRK